MQAALNTDPFDFTSLVQTPFTLTCSSFTACDKGLEVSCFYLFLLLPAPSGNSGFMIFSGL